MCFATTEYLSPKAAIHRQALPPPSFSSALLRTLYISHHFLEAEDDVSHLSVHRQSRRSACGHSSEIFSRGIPRTHRTLHSTQLQNSLRHLCAHACVQDPSRDRFQIL